MATTWTDWRPVEGDDWRIPDSLLPASMWQLRWFVQWEFSVPLLDPLWNPMHTQPTRGRWRWQILRGPAIVGLDPPLVFDQEVSINGRMTIIHGVLGQWVPDTRYPTGVRTTVPIRPPILGADPEMWTYDEAADRWDNPAETGYITDVQGNHFGTSFNLWFWYTSDAYQIPLTPGCCIRVPFHNVGARWLIKRANVQIRTVTARDASDIMVDAAGFTRIAASGQSELTQLFAADGKHFLPRRTALPLQEPSIGKEATNALVVGGMRRHVGWTVISSDDDGITWGTPTLVFDTSFNDVRMAVARDGTVVAVGQKGGRLYVRTGHDDFTHTADLGPARETFEIAVEQSSGALVVTDGKSLVHRSHDCGRTWTTTQITA